MQTRLATSRSPLASIAGAVVAASATGFAIAQPSFQDLGSMPGGGIYAKAISADGTKVVGFGGFPQYGFVWTNAGLVPVIPSIPMGQTAGSYIEDISEDGSTFVGYVNYMDFTMGGANRQRAFVNGSTLLGEPFPDMHSDARALSGNGQIAIGHTGPSFNVTPSNPCLWTGAGPTAFSFDQFGTVDLNFDGTISTGESSLGGARWTSFGTFQPLPVPAGYTAVRPFAIDSSGNTIVGTASLGSSGGPSFIWRNGIGSYAINMNTPFAVSGDGSTVGGVGLPMRAALYRDGCPTLDVQAFLQDQGVLPQGWQLHAVTAVNGDGTVIAGIGFRPDNSNASWIVSGLPLSFCCDYIDFNNDGVSPSSDDLDDFLSVFSGGPCSNDPNCADIDFNNDGVAPDAGDIDSIISVLGGGPCL